MYADHLKATGVATDADIKRWEKEYTDTLNTHFEMSKKITKLCIMDWVDTPWTGFFETVDPNVVPSCNVPTTFIFGLVNTQVIPLLFQIKDTGISQQTITTITNHFVKPPEPWAFTIHPGVTKILKNRETLVFDLFNKKNF